MLFTNKYVCVRSQKAWHINHKILDRLGASTRPQLAHLRNESAENSKDEGSLKN